MLELELDTLKTSQAPAQAAPVLDAPTPLAVLAAPVQAAPITNNVILGKYVNPTGWTMTDRVDRKDAIWEHSALPDTEWMIHKHWENKPYYLTGDHKIRVYPTWISDSLKANTVGMATVTMMNLEESNKTKYKNLAKAKRVAENKGKS